MATRNSTTPARTVYTSAYLRIDRDGPRDYSLYIEGRYAGSHDTLPAAQHEGAMWLARRADAVSVDSDPVITVRRRTLDTPGEDDLLDIHTRWREMVLTLDISAEPGVFTGALIAFDDMMIDALTRQNLRDLRAILNHPALAEYLS